MKKELILLIVFCLFSLFNIIIIPILCKQYWENKYKKRILKSEKADKVYNKVKDNISVKKITDKDICEICKKIYRYDNNCIEGIYCGIFEVTKAVLKKAGVK